MARIFLWTPMLLAAMLVGCASSPADPPIEDDPAASEPFVPRVTLAIIDTGLMPYHSEFLQVREGEDASQHPSSYLAGYPADAAALELSLAEVGSRNGSEAEEEDLVESLFSADEDAWKATEEGTLYWIPGSKVVGFISFGTDLPGGGHGSMTSSRAAGNTISIPGAEVLLVNIVVPLAIDTDDPPEAHAVRWAADQEWIDIQSNSWGFPAMCVGPAANAATQWMDAFLYARDKHLVLSATHNGHGNTGTLGYPSQCQDTAGPAGVVPVGANDNDGYARWSNWFPAISADGCRNPAISERSTHHIQNTGGGTSSATPFSAGGAAKLILEARRVFHDPSVGIRDGIVATLQEGGTAPETGPLSDGEFTMDELKQVLMRTALTRPQTDGSDGEPCGAGTHVPLPAGTDSRTLYPFIGYGEVNHDSVALGVQVLLGEVPMPERPDEDRMYEQDQAARRAMWG